jgi:hypothetical protein
VRGTEREREEGEKEGGRRGVGGEEGERDTPRTRCSSLQGHAPSDLLLPARPHLLKFPEPSKIHEGEHFILKAQQ